METSPGTAGIVIAGITPQHPIPVLVEKADPLVSDEEHCPGTAPKSPAPARAPAAESARCPAAAPPEEEECCPSPAVQSPAPARGPAAESARCPAAAPPEEEERCPSSVRGESLLSAVLVAELETALVQL